MSIRIKKIKFSFFTFVEYNLQQESIHKPNFCENSAHMNA